MATIKKIDLGEIKFSDVQTKPFQGQKPGTSGLRKKVVEASQPGYLHNFVQATFDTLVNRKQLSPTAQTPCVLAIGGDGRYWNPEAIQIIIKMAAANGVTRLLIGTDGVVSTPAVSAIIRKHKATGGLILTASHNPGGPNGDFGIKYNIENGGPAPESVTNEIYSHTLNITSYKTSDMKDVDISQPNVSYHGKTSFGDFDIDVIDSVHDYLELLKTIFDFDAIKTLLNRPDFKIKLDSMNGVTGIYSQRIFKDEFGVSSDSLINAIPLPDFGQGHPDPNLTYAHELVELMYSGKFQFGAAWDGDGDRNMILGNKFFVNPSDSLAIIVANSDYIPYFKSGLSAVSRSMPTGAAVDRVASQKKIKFYEVPTGWKFFGNIMDASPGVICGEESFGTGSDHIREKDGIWAVLAWLSIIAVENKNTTSENFISVEEISKKHWKIYGRNYFSRYDYEECDADKSKDMMNHLINIISEFTNGKKKSQDLNLDSDDLILDSCDDFLYNDQFDGSVSPNQGLRFLYKDGSRIIFRLSGTGSVGATIRLYVEKYENDPNKLYGDTQDVLKPVIQLALNFSKLTSFTGRDKPTVIT